MDESLPRIYPTLAAFYADRGGEFSPEVDFGVHNRHPYEPYNRYRVSVVAATGDVYAIGLHWPATVFLLGWVRPAANPFDSDAYADADRRFEGWADGPGPGRSLNWFMVRYVNSGRGAVANE